MVKRLASCPTCGCSGEFEFSGTQRWPAEVARRLNLPSTIHLWTCLVCETTICEQELHPFRSKAKAETQTQRAVTTDTYLG
jgi:hypothetical protein